jgi:rare lipoprotein A
VRHAAIWLLALALLASAGCATRSSLPGLPRGVLETRDGIATFYGHEFQGKPTASGARFDMRALVAAHPAYPFGTIVRVTNLDNGRHVQVRIVDRGPAASARAAGVVIDLSYRGAEVLRFVREGRARVRLEVLSWGDTRR